MFDDVRMSGPTEEEQLHSIKTAFFVDETGIQRRIADAHGVGKSLVALALHVETTTQHPSYIWFENDDE